MSALGGFRRLGVWLGIAVTLYGGAALAADTGSGSKNFRTPSSVPNYFSNEAGPMIGGAAETRRSPLYAGQAPAPAATPAPRQTAVAAIPPPVRTHIAMAEPRGRVLRARRGNPVNVHRAAVHGRAPNHVAAARRVERPRAVHASHAAVRAAARAPAKTVRTSAVHHRGRG